MGWLSELLLEKGLTGEDVDGDAEIIVDSFLEDLQAIAASAEDESERGNGEATSR